MKKMGHIKRMFACVMACAMAFVMLTGCKNGLSSDRGYTKEEASGTKVMVIGDYDVYLDELMVYAMQAFVTNSTTAEAVERKADAYKEQTLSLIRETKIIYDVAINNNVELNDEDMETANQIIANFKKAVPQEFFDKYGISDEVIEKVFLERTYASKFENDIKNDMGKKANEEIAEKYESYNFNIIYYLLFPTVEVTEDNSPATDSDGNYVNVSEDDKKKALDNAEEAVERLREGEDAEAIAQEYGITDYSTERTGYIGMYSDEVNKALESLSDGECSDVIEEKLGYAVIVMKSANNEDLKASYVYTITSDYIDGEFENLRNVWLSTIPVDPVNDMEGTVWKDFDIAGMAKDLQEYGVIGNY